MTAIVPVTVALPGMPAVVQLAAPITRHGAQQAAHRELSKGIYRSGEPSLGERLLQLLIDWLNNALARASEVAPGGAWGLLGLLVVVVVVVVVIRLRIGPLARTASVTAEFPLAAALTPEEHRRRADEHAAAGRYADAVRERLRAVVGELEQRTILEPRPGRTADEAAAEAAAALPGLAEEFRGAARLFDDVWYGGRPATADADAQIRVLDRRARVARPPRPLTTRPG